MARFADVQDRIRTALDRFASCRPSPDFRAIVPWAAYGLLLFLAVFGLKYAALNADDLINAGLDDVNGLQIVVSGVEPSLFPPGASIDQLLVTESLEKERTVFAMRDARLRLSLFPLFVGKADVDVSGRAYGGMGRVRLTTGAFLNVDWVRLALTLDTVNLAAIPQIREYDATMTGFATVETSLEGNWTVPKGMAGHFRAEMDDVDMKNRFGIIRAKRLEGCRIDMDFEVADGVMRTDSFKVEGEYGITLSAAGEILVDEGDFAKSRLRFSGEVAGKSREDMRRAFRADAIEGKAIRVSLGGEVTNPSMKWPRK